MTVRSLEWLYNFGVKVVALTANQKSVSCGPRRSRIILPVALSIAFSGCIPLSNPVNHFTPYLSLSQNTNRLRDRDKCGKNYSHIPENTYVTQMNQRTVEDLLASNGIFYYEELPRINIAGKYWRAWKVDRWMPLSGPDLIDYTKFILFIDDRAVGWFATVPTIYIETLSNSENEIRSSVQGRQIVGVFEERRAEERRLCLLLSETLNEEYSHLTNDAGPPPFLTEVSFSGRLSITTHR